MQININGKKTMQLTLPCKPYLCKLEDKGVTMRADDLKTQVCLK